jgi:hypothetical protein
MRKVVLARTLSDRVLVSDRVKPRSSSTWSSALLSHFTAKLLQIRVFLCLQRVQGSNPCAPTDEFYPVLGRRRKAKLSAYCQRRRIHLNNVDVDKPAPSPTEKPRQSAAPATRPLDAGSPQTTAADAAHGPPRASVIASPVPRPGAPRPAEDQPQPHEARRASPR